MNCLRWLLLAASAPAALADGVILAPGPDAARGAEARGAEHRLPDAPWKTCEVTASLLATAPGRSIAGERTTAFVHLGEDVTLASDLTIPLPQGTVLVHARARLRSVAATAGGVTYFVASEGVLRSTLGFQHPLAGREQFRHEVVEVTDQGTRLHEILAIPDLGLRVVMVLEARPVSGAREPTALEMLQDPVPGTTRRFRVEAFLKEGDLFTPLESATLATMDGRSAGMALTRLSSEPEGGMPRGMPGVPTVRMVNVPGLPQATAEEMGAMHLVPADRRFQDRIDALQRSIRMNPTQDLGRKLEGQRDLPSTPRKISEKKRKQLQELHRQQAIRQWAIDRSRSLPSSEALPEGWAGEEFTLGVIPVLATQSSLQVEITLKGHVKLPREEAFTAIDATLIEHVRFGETLELGLASLVREDEPLYDYVLRITPE